MRKPNDAIPNILLRRARESHGWTQEEMAEKIDTTSVTISRWESGVTNPNRYFCKKLSTLFGLSIAELGLLQNRPPAFSGSTPVVSPIELEVQPQRDEGIFFFNEPLRSSQECYGRKRERETLINRTYHRASTSLVGPRRIGKTWLFDYLRLTAKHELGSRFLIGYLDATMPSCQTVRGFAAGALEVLGLSTGASHGLLGLEEGLKLLKKNRKTPVLCIDEFEGMKNNAEFNLDFFRGMRAMTHSFGLVLIVISKQPISVVIGKDMETSGFFNIFEQIIIEPFQRNEAEMFILSKSRQAGFGPSEIEAFWRYAALEPAVWHPLRLQVVGKLLADERVPEHETELFWSRFEHRLETLYREVMY
jgi:transcriptional regulator with XRE-family HTH domain